jgi:hypothetical protein
VTRADGRSSIAALALALTIALAGCGDDDEERAATNGTKPPPQTTATEQSQTAQAEVEATESETAREPEPTETEPPTSPEDQPGGAGDEEPARSLALFTGRDGRIVPRTIRVPAYISIRVELRTADDGDYGLRFEGHTLRVSGGLSSVSTTMDGLRPGEAVVGRPTGADGNRVRIEATAEPGP